MGGPGEVPSRRPRSERDLTALRRGSDRAPILTVIGDLLEDVVVWTASTNRGTDNPATVRRTRGGSAANVAAHAAARVAARFIGRVGDDDTGDRLIGELRDGGVDVRAQRGGRTGTVVVIVDATGERTMYPDRAAAAALGSVDDAWLDGTAVLHVPAYGFAGPESTAAALLDAASRVRDQGGAVTFDASAVTLIAHLGPDRVHRIIAELSPAIVFANAAEARALELGDRSPRVDLVYIVKDGPNPATIVAGGRTDHVPARVVAGARDTTGAGDAFAAGFLAYWMGAFWMGAAWMGAGSLRGAVEAGHDGAAAVLAQPGAGVSSPG